LVSADVKFIERLVVTPLTMGEADTRLTEVFELEARMLKKYPAPGLALPPVVVTEMEEYVPVVASNTNEPKIWAPSESTTLWICHRLAVLVEMAEAVPPVIGR
jgi:hypothetical protein